MLHALALGVVASLGLASGLIWLAPRLGLMDVPGGRRSHAQPVAMVGGLTLVLAWLFLPRVQHLLGQPRVVPLTRLDELAVATMALLGLLDDRFDLRARWKAGVGLAVAVALAYRTAGDLARFGQPIPFLWTEIPATFWSTMPLLLPLFWGLPQAFNLIDGANGLATGFGLVILATLWLAGYPHPLLFGILVACLLMNWPKARLFLGDCGSLALGTTLVILARHALLPQGPNHLLWLFAYPILDVSMVVLIRIAQGRHPGLGDRNHFHFQIRDRWPRLASWAMPILLGLAALCSSELFVNGVWMILPLTGLSLLLALGLYLTFLSLAEGKASVGAIAPACGDPLPLGKDPS